MPRKKVEKEEEPKKKKKVVKEEVVEEIVEETTEEVQEKKINPVLKVFGLVLKIMFYVFIIAFVLVVILQRISGNSFSIFGYRMFNVVSGSMEPKYNIGDVLISKDVEADQIKVGDVISYFGQSGSFADKVVTHEVVSIEMDANGKRIYHTKGLVNVIEDPIVYEDQVFGVVKYKSILLSLIYKVVGKPWGMFVFVVLPMIYIIGSEILGFMLEKEEEKRAKLRANKEVNKEDNNQE